MLSLRQGEHEQPVVIKRLHLWRVDGCPQLEGAPELGRAEPLPYHSPGTLGGFESQSSFDCQRVLLDGDIDRIPVETGRHQRGKVSLVGIPNINWQGLEA